MLKLSKYIFIITLFFSAALILFFLSLGVGIKEISFSDIYKILLSDFDGSRMAETIILSVRLPRAVAAFVVGMALSVSGAVLQALFRNPLAEPHIIGVSSGAALGTVIMVIFFPGISQIFTPLFAFSGALLTLILIYFLSIKRGYLSVYTLILTGVVLNSFFVSVIIFIQSIVSYDNLASVFIWLLGTFAFIGKVETIAVTAVVAVVTVIIAAKGRILNIISYGDKSGFSLGVDVDKEKKILFILTAVITAVSVSISGLIGFVGLVVPHIVRFVFGNDYRMVLPLSAITGGILLLLSDTFARIIIAPSELPVGVVTAFIGAPFFIYLLKSNQFLRKGEL